MTTNPRRLIDAEPIRQHIRALMASGASIARITAAAGTYDSFVSYTLYGANSARPPARKVRADNAERVLAIRPEQITPGRIDATGSRRRIQALMARGWPMLSLGPRVNLHPHYVTEVLRNQQVYSTTAHAIAVVYDRLWNADPVQHGIPRGSVTRTVNYASRNHWAPPGAWDDGAIDDPAAHPDWTGHCGTDRGWRDHRAAEHPPCPPCVEAHAAWRRKMRRLPAVEREQAVAAALEASSKGAAVAENARELFAQGYTRKSAAARLGITIDWLDAELIRHPLVEPVAA